MDNKITINKECVIGNVEKDVFGGFIEHQGRSIYGGLYQPDHKLADKDGFRQDVIEAVKDLHVPIIRYPGGNMLSGYNWKDGIGENRPVRLELAWNATEPNLVGLHEFYSWTQKVGSELMLGVNMGTGTPKDAAEMVEYCNHKGGTYWSDMRRKNGAQQPFKVKKWCVGNEMDGSWQICKLTAEEYGRKVAETAKLMKMVDEDIELVACGSADIRNFPVWDRTVLENAYEYVDYISVHSYHTYTPSGRTFDFLSSHQTLDNLIKGFIITADYVKCLKRSPKTLMLSVDEWNVWHTVARGVCKNTYNDNIFERWEVGPHRVENVYDFADALAFSGLIMSLINHVDRVKMGCLAQLVNVIAPIMTDKENMVKQTTYYPYQMAIEMFKGQALSLRVKTDSVGTDNGETGKIYTACCKNGNDYVLWILNKDAENQNCSVSFENDSVILKDRIEMKNDLRAFNDFSHPNDVLPHKVAVKSEKASNFIFELPAYSLTIIKFSE